MENEIIRPIYFSESKIFPVENTAEYVIENATSAANIPTIGITIFTESVA